MAKFRAWRGNCKEGDGEMLEATCSLSAAIEHGKWYDDSIPARDPGFCRTTSSTFVCVREIRDGVYAKGVEYFLVHGELTFSGSRLEVE